VGEGSLIRGVRGRYAAFTHDLVMVPVAWLGALWLRFNLGDIPDVYLYHALLDLATIVPIQVAVFWCFGLYRGVWHFASLPDLVRIAKAVLTGSVAVALVLFMTTRLEWVPRSVIPVYLILLVGLLGGPRLLYRWAKDSYLESQAGHGVLIIGAGRAGEMLLRDLFHDPEHRYHPVGFLDDDPSKTGREIHGVRVLGPCEALPQVVESRGIEMVMIAIPSASGRDMKRIVALADTSGVPVWTLPGIHDLISGRVGIQELREVSIDDLLGRQPVSLDWQGISAGLAEHVVLVTGGAGSIGSELCRQLARIGPRALVVLERSEFSIYRLELELRASFPQVPTSFHLCDIGDAAAVRHFMTRHRPQIVFHAAAYKHLPMLEGQVREAVQNNILGTQVVAEAAAAAGVGQFVLISTDKAVNPQSIMGASKRAAEVFCQNLDKRTRTRFITVRFGNVLGSAGSVVPLFQEQIAMGGPVTVTHPEVSRYFMTIPEACQLILQAAVMGQGGEIFVLEMGEPVKIRELAEQMIRLAGKVPDEDIEVAYTGLRPGEKLVEELFHEKETLASTGHRQILLACHRHEDWSRLKGRLRELAVAVADYDEEALHTLLRDLVPEYACGPDGSQRAQVIPLIPRIGGT
jgi:FlaA1/EpsC-like NDP-sugar epimerase